ncbi:fructose-6-phosphate aldolase [Candidatus Paracaedibacter symbiosus]|uniref:fructose-6-phosphate aldolase n=1 Tax=Candidatus Paracaedibacter symbiosus TaxID=244582 RepID=UPI000509D6CE|nr:fructose-6-phosphate aldolase [Candidatus Paracaedibacter symbiosus]
MMIFLDSADLKEIEELAATGLVDGVTTNPSLVAASGMSFSELITKITKLVEGPVSAEVTALDAKGMIAQGRKLAKIAENVTVKVPLTVEGLKACKALSAEDIMVNVTLCFSLNQAILAAKAGATFVSPFVGRLDDCGADGMQLIEDIAKVYETYAFDTLILAASIRHPQHVYEAAKIGVDVVTIPGKVFRQLYTHPLTDLGLDAFMKDWKKSGLEI